MIHNDLTALYNIARPIPESRQYDTKDTWAVYNNLIEAKYLDVNDVLSNQHLVITSYIGQFNEVLLYPNRVLGEIVDIYVRPIFSKAAPLKLGNQNFPYNIGNLSKDFKYGDTLYLVEGIGDLAAVKLIKPDINIVAMQTSQLSNKQLEFLSKITNNFILLADDDNAGRIGSKNMFFRFKDLGCHMTTMKQYTSYKDTGDFLDDVIKFVLTKDTDTNMRANLAKMYYEKQLK